MKSDILLKVNEIKQSLICGLDHESGEAMLYSWKDSAFRDCVMACYSLGLTLGDFYNLLLNLSFYT